MKDKWYVYVRSPKTEKANTPDKTITIPEKFPLACISVEVRRDENCVGYGVAAWNPLDAYRKDIARKRADGRNNIPGRTTAIEFDPNNKPFEINQRILQNILKNPFVPHFDHQHKDYLYRRLPTRVLKAIRVMLDTPWTPRPKSPTAVEAQGAKSAAA